MCPTYPFLRFLWPVMSISVWGLEVISAGALLSQPVKEIFILSVTKYREAAALDSSVNGKRLPEVNQAKKKTKNMTDHATVVHHNSNLLWETRGETNGLDVLKVS